MSSFVLQKLSSLGDGMLVSGAFSGEPAVQFLVEPFTAVSAKVERHGWYAAQHLLLRFSEDESHLADAVRDALSTERIYQYRPWLQRDTNRKNGEAGSHHVEYFGEPDDIRLDGWVDVAVHLSDGGAYTLTVETPADIAADVLEDVQDRSRHGFFYCPDMLIVRQIDRELIASAISHLVAIGIERYGILAGDGAR